MVGGLTGLIVWMGMVLLLITACLIVLGVYLSFGLLARMNYMIVNGLL